MKSTKANRLRKNRNGPGTASDNEENSILPNELPRYTGKKTRSVSQGILITISPSLKFRSPTLQSRPRGTRAPEQKESNARGGKTGINWREARKRGNQRKKKRKKKKKKGNAKEIKGGEKEKGIQATNVSRPVKNEPLFLSQRREILAGTEKRDGHKRTHEYRT